MTKSHKKHSDNEIEQKSEGDTSSIKKHKVHHSVKRKSSTVQNWQIASAVLAILLIASIFTNGFSLGNTNKSVNVEKMTDSLVSAGLLSADKKDQAVTVLEQTLNPPKASKETVDKPLKVDLYVMSQCPYGVQAEDAMFKAIKNLGENNVDLDVNYIASPTADGFRSLHGPNEVAGDKVQLCVKELYKSKFLDFVSCMDKNPQSIPDNWEACADSLSLDKAKIKSCYEGDQANKLLNDSLQKSIDAKVRGSPTIYIAGDLYGGARGVNDFERAFCNAFSSEKPSACDAIPAPQEVDLVVLNDKRCSDCQAAQTSLVGQLKTLFPGLKVKSIDYSSAEGKALYKSANLKNLPAFLFDDGVKKEDNYDRLERYLVPAGKYLSLKVGATFDPTKEICDNKKDDTGNGLVDCADPDCKDSMVCRTEKPKNLQVFVMSDCPYGKKAIEALKSVRKNFGNNMSLEVHYIASDLGNGKFSSLHGTYEAQEDMTQLCVEKYSPQAWFDYIYCRSLEGIRGHDWKKCANETGVNETAVQACLDSGEGADLLRKDIKIAQSLGISASPTWLANNKYTFSGIDAETIKNNFCKYNPNLPGCENTLSSDSGSVPAGSCG